jgi:hypothetical protein
MPSSEENCLNIFELRKYLKFNRIASFNRFLNNELYIVNKNLGPLIDIVINFMKVLTKVRTIIPIILFI